MSRCCLHSVLVVLVNPATTPWQIRHFPSREKYDIIYSTSPIINMLHMYSGSVRLSFWSDSASSSPDSTTTTKYLGIWTQSVRVKELIFALTEKGPTNPHSLKNTTALKIDTTKPTVPSTDLFVVGDHLCFPKRRPMMEAWLIVSGYSSRVEHVPQHHLDPTPKYQYIEGEATACSGSGSKSWLDRRATHPSSHNDPAQPVNR